MENLNASQWLMLAGLFVFFSAYFALTWHKHKKGREMIMARDIRLYPKNYDTMTKSERKRLYRIHSWQEAWDGTGKVLALIALGGVVLFLASLVA